MDCALNSLLSSQTKFEDVSIKEESTENASIKEESTENANNEFHSHHSLPIGLDKDFLVNEAVYNDDVGSAEKDSTTEELDVDDPLLVEHPKDVILSLLKRTVDNKKCLESLCKDLKKEIEIILADQSKSSYEALIEELKNQLEQSKIEILKLKNDNQINLEKVVKESAEIKEGLTLKITNCRKQYEVANRDKEDMVVKYAMAEKEVIIVKKQKENVEKKVKELERDKDILQGKIKALSTERSRICNTLDNKIQENSIASRTIDKLKEELNSKDIKIKWSQSRLLNEIDAHKESLTKLDKTLVMVTNHEEEIRVVREEAEKMVRETKQAEHARENILEKQLQETKAKLIMESQKFEDLSQLHRQLKTESEKLLNSHFAATLGAALGENVFKYDTKKVNNEHGSPEPENNEISEQLKNLNICLRQLETEKLRAKHAEQSLAELQGKLKELQLEVDQCRIKEAELLAFTQKLTDKNVILQSQLTSFQGKVRFFELERGEIKSELENLKLENAVLQKDLRESSILRNEEELKLNTLLNERNEEVNVLKTKVSDLLNEVHVLNRKYINYTKDNGREIQKLRRKLESLECQTNQTEPNKHTLSSHVSEYASESIPNGDDRDKISSPIVLQEYLSQDSRTSSDTSLNTIESNNTTSTNGATVPRGQTVVSPIDDLPQHVLIARIIKLQKNIIKKSEKCDFLEEHVQQLLTELKKKNKIIYHYLLNTETGILSNAKSDSAKAAIIKHGGIMASVYGSALKDETMTLDLSLEINKKLQGVLEDTLLKNITLKENLNTLGDEVAKLTMQSSQTSGKS